MTTNDLFVAFGEYFKKKYGYILFLYSSVILVSNKNQSAYHVLCYLKTKKLTHFGSFEVLTLMFI